MDKLRLTYVKALSINQAHMVLGYFSDKNAEPLILDNLDAEIRPASERKDLLPVYSFNGEDLWLSKDKSTHKWVGSGKSTRMSLWQNLLKKYSDEMIQATIVPTLDKRHDSNKSNSKIKKLISKIVLTGHYRSLLQRIQGIKKMWFWLQ